MTNEFMLKAEPRTDAGKGASRRLRRQGRVPAILYGGGGKVLALSLDHNDLAHNLHNEAFHSHILTIKIGRKSEKAILKDVQTHPFKPDILHIDLMRIVADQEITMIVPLHFVGAESSPGVKQGGVFSRNVVEVEIQCLPKNLPEFLEVDVSGLEIGDALHLSDIPLLPGVALSAPVNDMDSEHNATVAAIHHARVTSEEEPAVEAAETPVEGAATATKESGDKSGESAS